ncbi:MAG: thiol-disulfide isomerase-like thioredoxin [Planctomycetaceae bacterium]|nr:thiol-disulfide isomerase-like thioredoxin [Planctomycetaceae bacterium]
MRRTSLILLLVGTFVGQFSIDPASAADRQPVIGTVIQDLRFKDIRGLQRSIADLGKKQAYVFVFTTTHCPLVQKTIPKLIELDARYASRNVQIVAVNVGADDSIRDMAAQAIELDAAFPFVKDYDLSCAKSLGVERTPEIVVLNADRKLVYRGRIDDQLRLGGARPEPSRRDLEEALNDVLENREVRVSQTTVDGCLITTPAIVSKSEPIPTFHQDIAPILQQRCVSCHRPNTAAPFSLLTFADAQAQAEMLAEVVVDQRMPPWYANPKHGTFQNDPSLSKAERDTLVRWVRTGRIEGKPPETPVNSELSTSKWRIGKPDLIITMLQQEGIPSTGFVPYRVTLLPYLFLNDTWVEAFEILPDNPAVVHHCNMAYVTTKGASQETFLTGFVPGGQPLDMGRFNNGVACFVPRFSTLVLQIHFTTTGKPEKCRISVGLRFPRRIVHKQFQHILLDPHRLRIPPEHGAFAVHSERVLNCDATLLGLFTHMHVRGKDATFFAERPDKSRETLLQIPNYNFEWQLGYEIEPGKKQFPKGTRIEAIAHYDNSAFNPYNPDSKRTVPWGQQTYDEMFNGFLFYVDNNQDLNLTVDPKTGIVQKPNGK